MNKKFRFNLQLLLILLSLFVFSCSSQKTIKNENSQTQSEIPSPQKWFDSFRTANIRLSSESLSWLDELKVQAEELEEEGLFKLDFVDRMTVLLLRRTYHLEKDILPFNSENLWALLLKDPRLAQWNVPEVWINSADPMAYANKKNPKIPLLFLEKEGDDWNLNLKKSLEIGLRPLEVKYSRLGYTGLGLALNFLALRGEKGVGDFLLKPLNKFY